MIEWRVPVLFFPSGKSGLCADYAGGGGSGGGTITVIEGSKPLETSEFYASVKGGVAGVHYSNYGVCRGGDGRLWCV